MHPHPRQGHQHERIMVKSLGSGDEGLEAFGDRGLGFRGLGFYGFGTFGLGLTA